MRPLLPAALLALFAVWSGTFHAGAGAAAAAAGHLALLAAAPFGWAGADPLGLGRRGRWLPAVAWLLVAAGAWASPVPRAGALAVALLPAFVALPRALAGTWRGERERRRGVAAIAVVVAGVAMAALALWVGQGSERAAQPLGHHSLLALWLAVLLPLAAVPALVAERPAARRLALAAPTLAVVALVASGSVAGIAGAAAGAGVLLPARRRLWLLPLVAAAAGVVLLRLLAAGDAGDPSWLARAVYWRGGLAGALDRPLLGWGAGSTAWTLGLHLPPAPGVVPAGEVVGDLHSLPVQLLYELGTAGSAAVALVAAAFAWRRSREAAAGEVATVRRAGLAGLVAGAVALLVTPTLGTAAPWVALAAAAAAALAATPAGAPRRSPGTRGWALGYVAVAAVFVGRLDLAHLAYDRARAAPAAPTAGARHWLDRAVALDPAQPLYRTRLAATLPAASGERAAALRLAADGAPGVSALSLAAGAEAAEAGAASAAPLLLRACATDPLAGRAPFLLALLDPASPAAPVLAGRAFLAEPLLLAAVAWERHPALLAAGIQQVRAWHGVDRGYRTDLPAAAVALRRQGAVRRLLWTQDERPQSSLSLLAFRRLPWPRPAPVATVLVRAEAARLLARLPGATALATSAAAAFPPDCTAPPRPAGGDSAAVAGKPAEKWPS